jgi:hypothetical protein
LTKALSLEESIRFYQKSLEIDSGNSETWISLSVAQYLTGRYKESMLRM